MIVVKASSFISSKSNNTINYCVRANHIFDYSQIVVKRGSNIWFFTVFTVVFMTVFYYTNTFCGVYFFSFHLIVIALDFFQVKEFSCINQIPCNRNYAIGSNSN